MNTLFLCDCLEHQAFKNICCTCGLCEFYAVSLTRRRDGGIIPLWLLRILEHLCCQKAASKVCTVQVSYLSIVFSRMPCWGKFARIGAPAVNCSVFTGLPRLICLCPSPTPPPPSPRWCAACLQGGGEGGGGGTLLSKQNQGQEHLFKVQPGI